MVAAGLAMYGLVRLLTNPQAVPGPFYTETGFLFERSLSVAEQQARFGGREWLFHLYNVSATLLTVILSEPRAGVYYALDALLNGASTRPWQIVNWVSSLGATAVIIAWTSGWRRLEVEHRRILILGTVVILSNSLFGYMYTRDRIPVLSGAAYALLLGIAGTDLWNRRALIASGFRRGALAAAMVGLGLTWAWRTVGTIVIARDAAWSAGEDWSEHVQAERGRDPDWDEMTDRVQADLERQARRYRVTDPRTDPPWTASWFERKHF